MARNGRRLSSLANRHTQLFSELAVDAQARDLLASRAVASPELRLEGLLAKDELLGSARTRGGDLRRISYVQVQQHSPYVDIEGSYNEYKSQVLSPGTRRSLARSLRQFERDHAPQFRIVEAPREASAEIEEAFALELAGWKGRDGMAILSDATTAGFFREVAASFDALGILRLSSIRVRGELAAFEISALDGDRLWSLKASFDERLARYSPGRLLRLAVIERCFELGLRTNEMLGADAPYKLSFATGTRTICSFSAHDRTPVSLARFGHRRYLRPTAKAVYLRSGGLTLRMAIRRAHVRARG
jgi:CelD/BcsL family acetyltransferase involved in cellulose biosynthesis